MFEKIKTKPLKYKARGLPKTATISNPLPALTSGTQNQGLSCFVPKENADVLKNVISIASNGAAGTTYYQSNEFTILQDAYAIKWKNKRDKLSNKHYLFLASAISKQTVNSGKYGWDYKANWTKVENEIIQLPITSWGDIDFAFIESFIAELQAERLAELQAYLLATGLNDYELMPQERQVLEKSNIPWGKFNLKKLFGASTRGKRLKSLDRIPGRLPFVTAGEKDEGISAYISNEVEIFAKNTTTIDMFGSAKYRNYKYGADDHIAVVHTEKLPKFAALFVTTAIEKSSHNGQFSYSRNFYAKDADQLNIQLPITASGNIDFSFMETFIRAIQKLVIKDLVLYAEREMEATKSVISNKNNK